MKNKIQYKFCILLYAMLVFTNLLFAQRSAHRIDGSPFPVSSIPERLYIVKDNCYTESELFTVNTLQGVLAKKTPQIYRDYGSGYSKWLLDLTNNYQVEINNTYLSNFEGLIEHFKDSITGYVLCNLHDNSANAAVSICGVLNAIAVTTDKVSLMSNLGIPMLEDVRSKDEQWAYDNYKDQFSKKIITYQNELKDLFLSDYSVYAGAFHFYDHINSNLTTQAFARMDNDGMLFGWGDDEFYTVEKASKNSLNVFPADWAINISTLTNFEAETKQKNHIEDVVTKDSVHTVCFLVSDGDNIQWLLSEFAVNQAWYGSHDRGKTDIGWTISPALCELAPTVMKYIYDHASDYETGRDYFVAGPSGIGYNYPSQFPAIYDMSTQLNQYMKKSDLNIVNVIDQPATLEGVKPYLDQESIDAVFHYGYSSYNSVAGNIKWYNHKPAIGGRFSFWEGFETVESLAEKLNNMPRDPKSQNGYSLISVNNWSRRVTDIKACVDLLNDKVRVVAPDEFVKLIVANIEDESDLINVAPEASVSVSSEYPDANYSKEKVIDKITGNHGYGEWASNGETKPWVKLTWPEERTINSILLYDRPNEVDLIKEGILTFSDGSSIEAGALPNNGEALKINFSGKKVRWVKFEVTSGGGLNVGLSEFEVYAGNINTHAQGIKRGSFSVYPNPSSDGVFYADVPFEELLQLAVYNINGTLVKSIPEYNSNDAIVMNDLPRGLYILKFLGADTMFVSKVICE